MLTYFWATLKEKFHTLSRRSKQNTLQISSFYLSYSYSTVIQNNILNTEYSSIRLTNPKDFMKTLYPHKTRLRPMNLTKDIFSIWYNDNIALYLILHNNKLQSQLFMCLIICHRNRSDLDLDCTSSETN